MLSPSVCVSSVWDIDRWWRLSPRASLTDIALQEIIAGKLTYELTRGFIGRRLVRSTGILPVFNMSAESIINRKALRDFHVLERYEAGIELKGSEVKSIRAGKANISDAFARIENGEAFLYNADIQPHAKSKPRNSSRETGSQIIVTSTGDRQALWRDAGCGARPRGSEALLEERKTQSRAWGGAR